MSRYPDWEQRLYGYLTGVRGRAWDPVAHNCALFALGAMQAILPDAGLRFDRLDIEQLPDSPLAAARVLAAHGGVRGLALAFFGSELLPPLLARRGDVLLADGDLLVDGSTDSESLGIFDGSQALFVGPTGIQRFALTACKGCWRAGA
ncbi:MAG: DUF6950 family protein [Burkholderiales bacterium]